MNSNPFGRVRRRIEPYIHHNQIHARIQYLKHCTESTYTRANIHTQKDNNDVRIDMKNTHFAHMTTTNDTLTRNGAHV